MLHSFLPALHFMHTDVNTGTHSYALTRVLTVQARSSFIYHTLLGVGVFNRRIIIRYKIGLRKTKQVCM